MTHMRYPDLATPTAMFRRIALAKGFLVHVWNAVENGDENDSYFWKRWGAQAGECEYPGTFSTEDEAWRNCCEANGLLVPYIDALQTAGFRITRASGFLACHWVAPDGSHSKEQFCCASEALMSCFIEHEIELTELEIDEQQTPLSVKVNGT